MKMKTQFDQQ